MRARRVEAADFERFDYVLAMDENNLSLLMSYGMQAEPIAVPDPYYGGPQDFERVLDMAEDAAQGLLRHIRIRHRL